MPISVSIIFTHQLWADALKALIDTDDRFRVTQMFIHSKTSQWLKGPDNIYLLEASYPDKHSLNAVECLKANKKKVIVVGNLVDNDYLELMIKKGLDAYVLKSCDKVGFFGAIEKVSNGVKYFCGPVTEILSKRLTLMETKPFLTEREKEVLFELVCLKKSNEIANSLNITEATVRTHRKNIMRKFGCKNYIGLLRYACREGLLDSPCESFCVGCKRNN